MVVKVLYTLNELVRKLVINRLTYECADRVVVLPQVRNLSLQQILVLLRQRCSYLCIQSFIHLLQYCLTKPQQHPL